MTDPILMIEDDQHLAAMVSEYLGANGFAVTVAPRAERGLALLDQGGFQAVLLDVMLPDRPRARRAEDERERIFAPFYRPSSRPPAAAGSGLGLALVRQIARGHGGEVVCLPREGGGTCFEVDLPAVPP